MPLTFAHSYNSAYTELPDSSYNIIEPLGKGWTHNYNCYLQKVADNIDSVLRYVISWGDGSMNSFIDNNGTFRSESKGVYATLTADAGQNNFTYKTKSQVSYIFSKYVLSNRTVYVLTSVKDRNNNSITLTWTPFPVVAVPSQIRLFKVQDGGGRYLQFGYETGEPSKIKTVTAVTGSISRNIGFDYQNNFSDLKAYINLKGDSTIYLYEDSLDITKNHLLKKIKLPKGNIVDNTYEKRKLKSTQMAGQYLTNVNTQFNYTASNNNNFTESDISTTRNGIALNSNIKQDQQGNVKNAVSPTGNLSLLYDNPVHSTKPTLFSNSINNLSASTNYDAMGNVTSVTKTGGGFNLKDSFTYNGFNDILTYINAKNYKTEFTYNANGNLTKIKDALGYETSMVVNTEGTVSKVTNPEGIYTDFVYDAFGNTTQSTLMNTITATAVYDGASRLTRKTDPNNVITDIEYDVNDLVKSVIADPTDLNNTMSYHYDKNDNLDTITNPKGGKTSLYYNAFDQMVEYKFGGFSKTYLYYEDGTLKTFTNQNGNSFNYNYNADGTLQSDGYASYAYDAEFNLQYLSNINTGKTITFNYDALKRTNSIAYDDFAGNTVLYDYDNNNNVTAMTYPGGFKVGYAYDSLDRLVRVYNFTTNNNFATYTYYKDGRLKDQVNGNGTKTAYRYDGFGRLDSIGNHTSGNVNIASYKFTMDNVGNHLSETNHEPALPVMAMLQTEGFTYLHDSLNRMKSRGTTGFTYDNNGNNDTATGQWNSSYTFDTKDNLLTSTAPALTCAYDGLENRRRKNDTLYVLDILGGSNVLMETDASGNPYSFYIHGLGLVCRLDAAQTNPAYYHYDYRGSTTAITNSSQTVTHSYRYGAFGEMLLATEVGSKNPYRYVGKYGVQYEGDSLYFMRARYYNAVKGRFLGEDPVWNVNLYGYGENNPVSKVDPKGMASITYDEIAKEYKIKMDWKDNWKLFWKFKGYADHIDNLNKTVSYLNSKTQGLRPEDQLVEFFNFLSYDPFGIGEFVTPGIIDVIKNSMPGIQKAMNNLKCNNDALQSVDKMFYNDFDSFEKREQIRCTKN
jgi:RHS repeat-associated protein